MLHSLLIKYLCAMLEYFNLFKEWLIELGDHHGVDPLFLGTLYLGSKVFFFSCLGWVFHCIKNKKTLVFPMLFASMSFSLPYVYLIISGRNISVWVYLLIGLIFISGTYSIWKKVTAVLSASKRSRTSA
jgi:hypothetical protein